MRVTGARNEAEADFIAALLLEEGIPSLVRRSASADVPEMLAAGSRDVMVRSSALADARQALLEGGVPLPGQEGGPSPARLALALGAGLALAALVVWLALGL